MPASATLASWPPDSVDTGRSASVGADAELDQDFVDPGVEVGRPQGVEPVEGDVVPALGGGGPVHQAGGRLGQLLVGAAGTGPAGQRLADRLAGDDLVLLGQVAQGGRRRVQDDPAAAGGDDPGQQLEEGRLADPVGADDADPALRPDREGDPVEDGAAAPVVGQVARHQCGRRR